MVSLHDMSDGDVGAMFGDDTPMTKYEKRRRALGESWSTANYRLMRDLLFSQAVALGHRCYRCQGALTRETFTIEHKEDWLNHKEPKRMFFDLNNLAYSHLKCNISASSYNNRKGDVVNGVRKRVRDRAQHKV